MRDVMSYQELIEKEREQRRQYILDIAEKQFYARGFTGVTMEDIAQEVGLNKATIYLYFDNKDSLFFSIVLRKMQDQMALLQQCMDQNLSGREKHRMFGRLVFDFARENKDYYRLLCTFGPERFKNKENAVLKKVLELTGSQLFQIRDLLGEGMKDGSVRDDIDPLIIALIMQVSTMSIICLD